MNATTLDLTADIIDVRDIIERFEALESMDGERDEDEIQEMIALSAILADLAGMGGDEQWRGDWYPVTLIRDSYFVEYVVELLDDMGAVPKNLPHYVEIDWERTASNIRVDYTSTEIDGITYLYR